MNKVDKVYIDLLKDILENGVTKDDRTGTGTKSVFGRQIRFNMNDGFPLLTTKRIHTKSVIHELLWFLQGDTNIKYLNDNGVTIWDEWADEDGDLGPVYGKQWVGWTSPLMIDLTTDKRIEINQIQKVIDRLKENPDCRRIMVSAWNVGELEEMALMPCHYGFQLYTRELTIQERVQILKSKTISTTVDGNEDHHEILLNEFGIPTREISLMWNQRSVDTFLGLPFNIASYAMLLHMFAQQVNMVPGELIGNLGDTHLYSNHLEYVEKQLQRNPRELPTLKLNKAKNIFSYKFEDFQFENYNPHPNWRNVPIAV